MKKLIFSFLAVLLLISVPSFAFAQSAQRNVTLSSKDTVNQDYFAAGDTVTLDGTVNGDAYVSGGTVTIDGKVNGDVLAAGGTIIVNGKVTHNIRTAGGTITINGPVGGNVTTAGGTITLTKSASVAGSLVGAGGTVSVLSSLGKGATIGSGQITVDAPVHGDLRASSDNISLGSNASISGNLYYISNTPVHTVDGTTISGTVTQKKIDPGQKAAVDQQVRGAVSAVSVFFKLVGFITTFLIGLMLVLLLPNYMRQTAETLLARPWPSAGIGALILFVTPIVMMVLIMTIIGIPLSLLLLIGYILSLLFAKIVGVYAIGYRAFGGPKATIHPVLILLLSLLVLELISIIPFVGGLMKFIIVLMGLGAMMIQKRNFYKTLRSRNEL